MTVKDVGGEGGLGQTKRMVRKRSEKAKAAALAAAAAATPINAPPGAVPHERRKSSIEPLPDGPYMTTGKFRTDFKYLCRQISLERIPRVVPRTTISEQGPGTDIVTPPDAEGPTTEDETKPKTFLIKNRMDYFCPVVQTTSESDEVTTGIFVKGWKVDFIMMNVFKQAWNSLDKLNSVTFFDVGIDKETLETLGNAVSTCPSIKTLAVEGNYIVDECWDFLMMPETQLENLHLRFNLISDLGAERLARHLPTSRLVQLDLACNQITEVGIKYIYRALRLNRFLAVLSLASNRVGDEGAKLMGELISEFPLSHEEVLARRQMLSEANKATLKEDRLDELPRDQIGHRDSRDHSGARASVQAQSSKKREDGRKSKRQEYMGSARASVMKETMTQKRTDDSPSGKDGSTQRSTRRAAVKRTGASVPVPEPEGEEPPQLAHPFLDYVKFRNKTLYVVGNLCLSSLNLSRNGITVAGMSHLLASIQKQWELKSKTKFMGLYRLSLQGNLVTDDEWVYVRIQELMASRNPLLTKSNAQENDK